MEADAKGIGRLASGEQKRLDLRRFGAELRCQAELGVIRADSDPDEQVEVGRALGGADDLVELVERVEREGLHAMVEIGLGDDLLGLHRVHEALNRLRKRFGHQPDFADRGDVVMGDTRIPQKLQQVGRGVRLHRIERAAGELLDEEARGPARGVRTQQRDRLDRTQRNDVSGRPAVVRKGR